MKKKSKFDYWLGVITIMTITMVYILYNILLLSINMLLRLSIRVYDYFRKGIVEKIYWSGPVCMIRAYVVYCISILHGIYIAILYSWRDHRD